MEKVVAILDEKIKIGYIILESRLDSMSALCNLRKHLSESQLGSDIELGQIGLHSTGINNRKPDVI